MKLNAVSKRESSDGQILSFEAANAPYIVELKGEYTAVKSISVTPISDTFKSAVIDNISLGENLSDIGFETWPNPTLDPPVGWKFHRGIVGSNWLEETVQVYDQSTKAVKGTFVSGYPNDYIMIGSEARAYVGGTIRFSVAAKATDDIPDCFTISILGATSPTLDGFIGFSEAREIRSPVLDHSLELEWIVFEAETVLTDPAVKYFSVVMYAGALAIGDEDIYIDECRLRVNTFDVYIFDNAGSLTDSDFIWEAALV